MKEKTNIEKQDAFDPARVFRGGSWDDDVEEARVSYRDGRNASKGVSYRGFRLVLQTKDK